MTYAWVDVRHPDKTEFVRVRTLVDTGSTDCELKADVIRKLGLPATGETAHFETAVGRVTEQPIYEAVIRVLGREARVVLSPADGDESDDESDASDEELDARFGFDRVSDEGMLARVVAGSSHALRDHLHQEFTAGAAMAKETMCGFLRSMMSARAYKQCRDFEAALELQFLGFDGVLTLPGARAQDAYRRSKSDFGTPRARQERPGGAQERPRDGPKTLPGAFGAMSERVRRNKNCRTRHRNDFSLFFCCRA